MFHAGGGKDTIYFQNQIENPGAYIVRVIVQHEERWRQESRLMIFPGGY